MINRNSKYFLSLLFPYFYYFILVISLFLSFSRGTLLLMGFYTIFQIGAVGKSVIFKSKRTLLIATIAVFSISSFIIFSYLSINSSQLSSLPRSRLERQLYKPLLLNEGRIQYFQQAIAGIKERPFLGHGPGTFYLISKRYQERPNHYSWFAHNFILQELSEIGIIGTIFLIVLISYPLLNNKVLFQRFSISQYFLASIYIILLNSLFDFNLDFLIIWLILWSLLSLISIKNLDRY